MNGFSFVEPRRTLRVIPRERTARRAAVALLASAVFGLGCIAFDLVRENDERRTLANQEAELAIVTPRLEAALRARRERDRVQRLFAHVVRRHDEAAGEARFLAALAAAVPTDAALRSVRRERERWVVEGSARRLEALATVMTSLREVIPGTQRLDSVIAPGTAGNRLRYVLAFDGKTP